MSHYALAICENRKWVAVATHSLYGVLLGMRDSQYNHIPIKMTKILVLETNDDGELVGRIAELNRKK